MKTKKKTIVLIVVGAILWAGTLGWADVPQYYDDFYFWKLGHMDGPHDESKALGISRDGKVAVGSTMVVDFRRAWRLDIDWAIATDDGIPPLYNELQVQEDIGIAVPSQPSAAYAASDMTADCSGYDKVALAFDWCGSKPVGTLKVGTVSYAAQWLLPVLESVDEGDYVTIPDYGGGLADMRAKDVTVDGTIMVGFGNNKRGQVAFRADMTDPLLPVVKTLTITDAYTSLQTLQTSSAEAVSADGLIIAGYGATKIGNRAFVTTVLDATTDPITLDSAILPMLAGGKFAEAYAMTPDGAIIAGRSGSPLGPQACIWFKDDTDTWVIKGLGGLSKSGYDSVAYGVAYKYDPTWGDLMVVGKSKTILYPEEAFVWAGNPVLEDDGIGYMYDLEYILIKSGAGTASTFGSSWILNEATGISDDGTRIVGWGVNPERGIEAFAVTGYPQDIQFFDEGDTGGEPSPKPKDKDVKVK